MASEIRVNRLSNRSGLSTITFANGGVQFSGITTFANGDFRVGTGATIMNPSSNEMQFHTGGSSRLTINNSGATIGALTATTGTFSSNVSIGGVLTYEDVKNVDAIGIVTARTGAEINGGDLKVGTAVTFSAVTGNVTQDVGITTFSGSAVWFKGATANKDMYWSHASGATAYKDNAQILMGDSSDLQIYHDGSSANLIKSGAGQQLGIHAATTWFRNAANSETTAKFIENGSVELYHNNIMALRTEANGIYVPGPEGGNSIIYMYADEGDDLADKWTLQATTSAEFTLNYLNDSSQWEKSIECNRDGNVELYHNNVIKLETDNDGIRIGSGGGDNTIIDLHNASYDNGVIQYYNGGINLKTGSSNGDRQISLYTAGTQRLVVHANGGISVGVDNNAYELTVQGKTGGAPTLWLRDGTTTGSPRIIFGDTGNALQGSIYYHNNGDYMTFSTNGSTEKLRIDSSGRVQIGGVTGPNNSKLFVAGTNSTNYITMRNTSGGDGNGDRWNNIRFQGTQSGGEVSTLAILQANHDGTGDDEKGAFQILLNDGNDGDNAQERLRIDSTGRLLLGTQRTYSSQSWYDDITINNSNGSGQTGGTGISLISSSNSWNSIYFGDGDNESIGGIKYDHNTNSMRFVVNTIDPAVLISSTGRLLIGTTTANGVGSYSSVVSTGAASNNGGFQAHYNTGAYGGGSMTTINAAGGGLSFWTYTGDVGSESYTERMRIGADGTCHFGYNGGNTNAQKVQITGTQHNFAINNWGNTDGDYWVMGSNITSNSGGSYSKGSNTTRSAGVNIDGRIGRITILTSQTSTSTINEHFEFARSGDFFMRGGDVKLGPDSVSQMEATIMGWGASLWYTTIDSNYYHDSGGEFRQFYNKGSFRGDNYLTCFNCSMATNIGYQGRHFWSGGAIDSRAEGTLDLNVGYRGAFFFISRTSAATISPSYSGRYLFDRSSSRVSVSFDSFGNNIGTGELSFHCGSTAGYDTGDNSVGGRLGSSNSDSTMRIYAVGCNMENYNAPNSKRAGNHLGISVINDDGTDYTNTANRLSTNLINNGTGGSTNNNTGEFNWGNRHSNDRGTSNMQFSQIIYFDDTQLNVSQWDYLEHYFKSMYGKTS